MAKNSIYLPDYSCTPIEASAMSETVDWGLELIPNLRELTDGTGSTVTIADTGVDFTHPDLQHAKGVFKDFTGRRTSDVPTFNHGTACAGLGVAAKNNSGLVGSMPGIIVNDSTVLHPSGNFDNIEKAILDFNQSDSLIFNMSFGANGSHAGVMNAINAGISKGKIFVAAAGNQGFQGVMFPANYSPVIAVGAVDKNKKISNFSSVGNTVDIFAPGEGVRSTDLRGQYSLFNGTSFAGPFVSFMIGGLFSIQENKSQAELEKFLKENSTPIKDIRKNPSKVGLISDTISIGAPVNTDAITKEIIDFVKLKMKELDEQIQLNQKHFNQRTSTNRSI